MAHSNEATPWRMLVEPMNPRRILVVEDDALLGMLLAETLGGLGHEVCAIAATEADAVAEAARHDPNLMIVDVNLGNGSGIVAVRYILGARFIPHIFMSGDISRVREHYPDAVMLRKPFKEAVLIHAIQRAVEADAPGWVTPS